MKPYAEMGCEITLALRANAAYRAYMDKQYIDWREHALPEELARIAELENMRFAHTREKTRIRNRCYARANQRALAAMEV